ncbi:MAG: hypothetical protein Q8O02_00555 [Candidatus Omnitrophota bacterium]|nr:hypothetical protein [Candidatus Omnitrophota bacterium]
MDKQTSDERLLKIIEGSNDSRKTQVNGARKQFGQPAAGFKFNFGGLKNVFIDLKFNLAKINTGLIGLGIFLALIFIYTFFSAPAVSKSNAAYFTPADSAAVVKFILAGEAQGLIRKNIGREKLRRNFFLPADVKEGGVTAQENVNVLEELKDFKLVGIIWSQNPEVMIENTKDSRTYTFKKGESLNEQFKIKEISRNSTILEVNSGSGAREYELR